VFRWQGGVVVRLQALHRGLPIYGKGLWVHTQHGRVTAVRGGLTGRGGPAPVRWPKCGFYSSSSTREKGQLRAEIGRAIGLARSAAGLRVAGRGYWVTGNVAEPVWKVAVYLKNPVQKLVFLVSDADWRPVAAGRGLLSARAEVFDRSPLDGDPQDVELAGLGSCSVLEGGYAQAFQCGGQGDVHAAAFCAARRHEATSDSDGDFLFPPHNGSFEDPFAEVQAYHHVTTFSRWLEERFGFRWRCGAQQAIRVYVNLDWPDAFYGDTDGDVQGCGDITLGQGAIDFSYDAEIIYHETAHAMVDATAGLGGPFIGMAADALGLNLMPTALNEGFADYFSASYSGDPQIAEYIGHAYGASSLRSLDNARTCPADINGEPHNDGLILSGALWSLRQRLGAQKADQLAYGTLLSLPPDADYPVIHDALCDAAFALATAGVMTADDVAAVRAEIGPAGRDFLSCSRIRTVEAVAVGAPRPTIEAYAPPTYPQYLPRLPASLQWKVTVPADSARLKLYVTPSSSQEVSWTVYLRRDEPVDLELDWQTVAVTANHVFGDSPPTITLDRWSAPRLSPETTYYVAVVYTADEGARFGLSAEWEPYRSHADPPLPPESIYDSGPKRPATVSCSVARVGSAAPKGAQEVVVWACVLLMGILFLHRSRCPKG
jgi:hypothetical protein